MTGGLAGLEGADVLTGNVSLSADALLEFAGGGEIASIAADSALTLIGPSAFVADAGSLTSNSALTGLATIAGAAALSLENGASVKTAGALANNGTINISGVATSSGAPAALSVTGALSGSGTANLSDGGILKVGSSASEGAIAFGSGGEIELTTGATLGATVTGLVAGDSIDFQGVAYTSGDSVNFTNVTATGETVTIDNSAQTAVASFAVLGAYMASQFAPINDGSGHLLVSGAGPDNWLVANVSSAINWTTASDWSGGTPIASSQVVVAEGAALVAAPITIGSVAVTTAAASLIFGKSGASVVTGNVANAGTLLLAPSGSAAGLSLSIAGVLTNSGSLEIAQSAATSSLPDFVSASAVNNSGEIELRGDATASGEARLPSGRAAAR